MQKQSEPSRSVLLWTQYVLLVVIGLVAVKLLANGDLLRTTGGATLLWGVINRLRTLLDQ